MCRIIPIATIVEGDGEVEALPILLRRMTELLPLPEDMMVNPLKPIRVKRDQFLNKPSEFNRFLALAAAKAGEHGWVLIILDADDDCPATLGTEILAQAQTLVPRSKLSVILANREFEAWFIAAAQSLSGMRGFTLPANDQIWCAKAEEPRNAKGWLEKRMDRSYKEILDQPAFTAKMDLQQAQQNSRSFRKLCKEWQLHIV